MWKNLEYWVRDFNVDGFRCDVADGVPLDFWEAGRERLEKIRPDIGMLAEGTKRENQLKAFDLCYGWGKAFMEWNNAAAVRKQWTAAHAERPIGGAKFARFIDNHDFANDDYENRLEKRWGTARVEAALVGLFTLDGVPFLYNGQEVADAARHSIFGRAAINWANAATPEGRARFALCQKLCAVRTGERALTQGEVAWLDSDQPEAVLSFVRKVGDERVLTVINLTDKPVKVSLKSSDGNFKPLLEKGVTGEVQSGFEFGAYGYYVGKK